MVMLVDRPAEQPADDDLYAAFGEFTARFPDRRVEIVDGRIVVKKVPTDSHNAIVWRLIVQLMPFLLERKWEYWVDVTLFLGPQADRYRPDGVIVGHKPRMWSPDHVYAGETKLVIEVVSDSSRDDDNRHKPRQCAIGGVPLYLVVDLFAGKVRLLSNPSENGYGQQVEVVLGEELALPAPWDLAIDTDKLLK